MLRRPIPALFLLIALPIVCFFAAYAKAGPPAIHVSSKPTWLNTYKAYDKSIPARSVDNGYFFQLIEEQVHVEKQADYVHIIRQIVSDAGVQNGSEISISFDPSYQKLELHQITVWRDNKPQDRLLVNAFKLIADEKELSKFIYQGTYSAYCILPDIRKGDRIEFSYTITGFNPILGNKYCHDFYFQQSQPIAHIYRSILASPQRKLNFKAFNKVPKTNLSDKNGLKCYEWEDFQVQPAHDYDNQAGWYTSYGYIQISDFANWEEVVNWALKINPLDANINGKLAKQVAELKLKAGDDKTKYFRSAVRFVQDEIRYMGVEIGEYSHRANSPEKVFNQRYGDCKDKSLLLASILTAGGIPANMVLINTAATEKTDQYLPSPFVFDHATVVANLEGKQVWIDPTISYQRGLGTDIYYPNYAKGLIIKAGNTGFAIIPPSKTGYVKCTEQYKVLADNGRATLNVVTTYTLNQANKIRAQLASSSMAETEKSYLDYYAKTYPKVETQDSITVKDDEEKNELTTIENYLVPDLLKKDSTSDRYEASFYASYIGEQLADINNKSRYPLVLNYPYAIDYTINVILPSRWIIDARETSIKRDAYAFKSKISATNDTLFLNYQFRYLKNFLLVDKLDEYRNDVKTIKDNHLSYRFTYTPGGASPVFHMNYWMLPGVGVFTLFIIGLFIKIYHKETQVVLYSAYANYKPLGGWLVLITIGLALTVVFLGFSIGKGTYFDLDKWHTHNGAKTEYNFKILFAVEALGNMLMLCYAAFCLILILKKRDIFPKYVIGFYAYVFIFLLADHVVAKLVFGNAVDDSGITSIVRSAIVAVIWIPYFRISTRVRETFIVPYPANNFVYQHQEVQPQLTEENDSL